MKNSIRLGTAIFLLFGALNIAFADPTTQLRVLGQSTFPDWINNPEVISAVKAQNTKNANLTEADIITLDKQWRAETKASDQPLVKSVLGNSLSAYLSGVKNDSAGLYTEIFVMDNKGINVGQSDVTSDYWQGDEAKWQKTFSMGSGAVHVGEIEMDDSSQQFQSQVSMSISDPASGEVIGAVTVGVNVDAL